MTVGMGGLALAGGWLLATAPCAVGGPRELVGFDGGWRFHLGNVVGGEGTGLDDGGWRELDLPHDWSAEGDFDPRHASGTGYLPGGVGWYRKSFVLPAEASGRRVSIEFDGVMRHSDVWINGEHLGHRPSGYTGFRYDLSPHLREGGNVVAVRVARENVADSRWYPGSGIYRHVRLVVTGPLRIAPSGVFVTTPRVSGDAADVAITTEVANDLPGDRELRVAWEVIDPDGVAVGEASDRGLLAAGGSWTFGGWCRVARPRLWSPDSPRMYRLVARVFAGEELVDELRVPFGIRFFRFDPARGFLLNGEPTRLKGLCLHHDGGVVGAAVPEGVLERRLRLVKQLGANAVRCAHNPMAPEFYSLCDRLGLLVMDEAFDEWEIGKRKWVKGRNVGSAERFGYAEDFEEWAERDLAEMVRSHRNHPSIILWSIGNEIDYPTDPYIHPESRNDPDFDSFSRRGHPSVTRLNAVAPRLIGAVKREDPTRPVTMALANVPAANGTGLADMLDVAGYNYQEDHYDDDLRDFPGRVIYGSENGRRIDSWLEVLERPAIAGLFLWVGFDFLGEAGEWPSHGSGAGVFDRCGFLKPSGHVFEAAWATRPLVRAVIAGPGRRGRRDLLADWTRPGAEGERLDVWVFSNCEVVEVRLDGEPVGRGVPDRGFRVRLPVVYRPGELAAVGLDGGREVARDVLRTAGAPARLSMNVDGEPLSGPGSVAHVVIELVDERGVRVPRADGMVSVGVAGPARLLGLDNGDQSDPTPLRSRARRPRNGRLLAIVQAGAGPGEVVVTAACDGLDAARLTMPVTDR